MDYMEKCIEIKQEFSLAEISCMIEELRRYVDQNALTLEVASRANGTLYKDKRQALIDERFFYGLNNASSKY